MKYHESEEMYLETILLLKKQKSSVYSIDIANGLEYSRASVSRAVNLLQKSGYIVVGAHGEISFTEQGKKRAEGIYERHRLITNAFVKMGADKSVAEENACRVEHVISEEMMEVLKKYSEQ